MSKNRKELIYQSVNYAFSKLIYHDRIKDDDLKVSDIEQAVIDGEVDVKEIAEYFSFLLSRAVLRKIPMDKVED